LASTLSDPEEIAGHTPVVAEPTTGKPHLAIQQLRGQRHEPNKSGTARAVRYRPGQQRHETNKSGTARAVRYRPVFQKPLNYRPTAKDKRSSEPEMLRGVSQKGANITRLGLMDAIPPGSRTTGGPIPVGYRLAA
jgi:hypothetical protein